MVRMTEEDLNALRAAAATLEHPGMAARLGNIAGKPIELVGRALPEAASEAVATATTKALHAALAVALRTMEKEPRAASRRLHKALAASSGAVGGGFGLTALPVEHRCPRAARQIGRGGRTLYHRTRGDCGRLAGSGPAHCANRIPLWRGGDAEGRSTSCTGHRRARWCSGELRIHRPLPGGGACALRRAPARTALRQECCPCCI
jgi:hypothetical protein